MAEYKNAQSKIFILLIGITSVPSFFLKDKHFPSWWSQELSVVVGLALFGLCFWLSGIIDEWLRKD